jgi:hypothetical protein
MRDRPWSWRPVITMISERASRGRCSDVQGPSTYWVSAEVLAELHELQQAVTLHALSPLLCLLLGLLRGHGLHARGQCLVLGLRHLLSLGRLPLLRMRLTGLLRALGLVRALRRGRLLAGLGSGRLRRRRVAGGLGIRRLGRLGLWCLLRLRPARLTLGLRLARLALSLLGLLLLCRLLCLLLLSLLLLSLLLLGLLSLLCLLGLLLLSLLLLLGRLLLLSLHGQLSLLEVLHLLRVHLHLLASLLHLLALLSGDLLLL